MKKEKLWKLENISQYKINQFTEAYSTMKILNIVWKNVDKFENNAERIYIKGLIRRYYARYKRIWLEDENLRKILIKETERGVKRELDDIFKWGL